MNVNIENALNHKTIREFKDRKVDKDIVENLLEVANHSASSNGMQLFTIIRVTDQDIKDKLSEIGR